MERLQLRTAELPGRAQFLCQSLKKVDECIAILEEKVEEMIANIRKEETEIIQEMITLRENLKRDINIAMQEAENTIFSEEVPSISPLGKLLRDPSVDVNKLTRFAYYLENDFKFPLRNYIAYTFYDSDVASCNPTILFSINEKVLQVYNLPEGGVTKHCLLTRTFTVGTIFCQFDDNRILCVGGDKPNAKETYCLSIGNDSKITAAADMITARGWPGVIRINSWVYVFGGGVNRSRMRESEKYSIEGNNWQPLLSMSIPKHAFSPCCLSMNIFLVEIRDCQGIEKFSLISETYTTLSVTLPWTTTASAYNVLKDREIVFLSIDKQVCRWNIDTNAWSAKEFTGSLPAVQLASNCPPLCMGNKVYFVQQDTGKIATYNFISSHLIY